MINQVNNIRLTKMTYNIKRLASAAFLMYKIMQIYAFYNYLALKSFVFILSFVSAKKTIYFGFFGEDTS